MSLRRIFHLSLVCLLIIGFLANPASASGYVWCVSTDGNHAALEFAPAGNCARDDCVPAAGSIVTSALEAEADDCGPCLDISSAHQWNVSRSRHGALSVTIPAPATPAVLAASFSLPERVLNSHRLVDPSPRIPDPILRHRTTVLLI